MEFDVHGEVIEVITVELLVHIRITNYTSNNMTLPLQNEARNSEEFIGIS